MTVTTVQTSSSRRYAVIALRLALTAVAGFCFYLTFVNIKAMIAPPDDDGYWSRQWEQGPVDRTRYRSGADDVVLPWPRYPGASVLSSVSRQGKLGPVAIEDLEVNASGDRILQFYRKALRRNGWNEPADQAWSPGALAQSRELATQTGMQQEQILRDYDGLRSNLLLVEKRNLRVMVTIEDGSKKWKKKVRLMYFPENTMDFVEAELSDDAATHTSQFGRDEYTTRFLSSSKSVPAFYDEQDTRLQSQGWVKAERANMPEQDRLSGSRSGFYVRGDDGALLIVSPNTDRRGSGATLTSIAGVSR